MRLKYLLWSGVGVILLFQVQTANADPIELNLSPIVGYEQVQTLLPTPHTTTRIFYGALVTVGVPLVSGEAQFTRGTTQETFSNMTQSSTGDRLKVGLRSTLRLSSLLSAFARAGVEAYQETTEQTENGITTRTYTPISYRPYAGIGARAGLSNKIYATADVVAIFRDLNNLGSTEYQASAGFAIRLP